MVVVCKSLNLQFMTTAPDLLVTASINHALFSKRHENMWQSLKLKFLVSTNAFIWNKQLNGISNILLTNVIMHFEAKTIQNTKYNLMKYLCKFVCLEYLCLALNNLPAILY